MKIFKKIERDWRGFYHKVDCPYQNRPFTVINNREGSKVPEGQCRYCFYCGTKLR